jgi:hypothetical protein
MLRFHSQRPATVKLITNLFERSTTIKRKIEVAYVMCEGGITTVSIQTAKYDIILRDMEREVK